MSIEALVAWAVAGGAYLEPIEIRVGPDGNRSVFARRAIAAGELIVAIPRKMIIGRRDVATSAVAQQMQPFASMLHSQYMALAVCLALEKRSPSVWAPYVNTLPPTFPAWTPDVLAALDGTRAGELLQERARNLDDDWSLLRDLLPQVASISRDEIEWALRVARSRCFEIATAGGHALVPIFDMFDHAPVADVFWSFDDETCLFEVHAARDIGTGEEIRHRYGIHDNARWLASYGFVIDDNPDNEVTLRFGTEYVHVGSRLDERFQQALALARDIPSLQEAARRADERIAGAVELTSDPYWEGICRIVRAGERAVLAAILVISRSASRQ